MNFNLRRDILCKVTIRTKNPMFSMTRDFIRKMAHYYIDKLDREHLRLLVELWAHDIAASGRNRMKTTWVAAVTLNAVSYINQRKSKV